MQVKPLAIQLIELQSMNTVQLKARYLELFGEDVRSNNRQFIIRRLSWRIQASLQGGLTKRALDRADMLANLDDIRLKPPTDFNPLPANVVRTALPKSEAPSLPGTYLTREYKGRLHAVKVLERGFEYEGKEYRSLTAVTLAITGSKWSGRHFFGLTEARKEMTNDC